MIKAHYVAQIELDFCWDEPGCTLEDAKSVFENGIDDALKECLVEDLTDATLGVSVNPVYKNMWEEPDDMTLEEKVICEVYTGICFTSSNERGEVYKYAEKLMGRPVYTHEFLTLADTLKEKARDDFIGVCAGKFQSNEQ